MNDMTLNEYQRLAARTINPELTKVEQVQHSLHGLSAEVGELNGLYQKFYQGHAVDPKHAKKEAGDIAWMLAEYCTANGWSLDEVFKLNIDKLWKRYPDGFDTEHSIHRDPDDI